MASEIFLEEIRAGKEETFIPKKIVLMPELVVRGSSLRSGSHHSFNSTADCNFFCELCNRHNPAMADIVPIKAAEVQEKFWIFGYHIQHGTFTRP